MSDTPLTARPLADPPKRADDSSLINLPQLLLALREHWLGAVALAFLACALLGYLLLRQPAVYAASATLMVETSNDRVVDIKQVVDDTVESSLTDALLLTHIQQIRSHTFLIEVVASLTAPERELVLQPYARDFERQAAASGKPVAPEESQLESIITQGLVVERSGRTLLISLTERHRTPAAAQLLADRIAEQYITHLLNRSGASNETALNFLKQQAELLRLKDEVAEHDVQAYREKYNLVFLEQNQNIVVERLRSLSASVTQARVSRLALDARLSQAESIVTHHGDAQSLASLPEFANVQGVQRQIDDLKAKRALLAERYGRRHPLMQENASALETLEKFREQHLEAAIADLRNQRDKALVDEKQLGEELAATEKESLRLDQLAVGYNVLRRVVDTTRQTYEQILGRLNETSISSRLQTTNVRFVDHAGLPNVPVEPNRLKVLMVVATLGCVLMIGYPVGANMLDHRIKSWSDVPAFLGAPLIGEISATKIPEKDRAWIVARETDELIVEAFRGLCNQLRPSSRAPSRKVLMVTSTIPAEGKSFVVCNLGASFAAHGRRTLLVDTDFRQPALHHAFQLRNDAGLLRWFQSGVELMADLREDPELGLVEVLPGLTLLRSGGNSRRLTEMLESGRLAALFAALRQQFDLVIMDTSPAGVFPDAEAMTRLSDELVYVCRFKSTNRNHARQILARLTQREIHFAGVVLNGMPINRKAAYYSSAYAYGARYYQKYYSKVK